MDDDDLQAGQADQPQGVRRGGRGAGGDALLSFAVEIVLTEGARVLDAGRAVRILGGPGEGGGPEGMVAGQVVDMESQGRPADAGDGQVHPQPQDRRADRERRRCGAIAAGAIESVVERMSTYGAKSGLAFQIVDDVLDVEGKFGDMKAGSGLDEKRAEDDLPGGVRAGGIQGADAAQLVQEAKQAVAHLGEAAVPLLDSGRPGCQPFVLKEVCGRLGYGNS